MYNISSCITYHHVLNNMFSALPLKTSTLHIAATFSHPMLRISLLRTRTNYVKKETSALILFVVRRHCLALPHRSPWFFRCFPRCILRERMPSYLTPSFSSLQVLLHEFDRSKAWCNASGERPPVLHFEGIALSSVSWNVFHVHAALRCMHCMRR